MKWLLLIAGILVTVIVIVIIAVVIYIETDSPEIAVIVAIVLLGAACWSYYSYDSRKYDPNIYKPEIATIVQTTVKNHPGNSNEDHYDVFLNNRNEIEEKTTEMMMQKTNLSKKDVKVDVSYIGLGDPTLKYDEYEKTKKTPYCKMEITIRENFGNITRTMYIPLT